MILAIYIVYCTKELPSRNTIDIKDIQTHSTFYGSSYCTTNIFKFLGSQWEK